MVRIALLHLCSILATSLLAAALTLVLVGGPLLAFYVVATLVPGLLLVTTPGLVVPLSDPVLRGPRRAGWRSTRGRFVVLYALGTFASPACAMALLGLTWVGPLAVLLPAAQCAFAAAFHGMFTGGDAWTYWSRVGEADPLEPPRRDVPLCLPAFAR